MPLYEYKCDSCGAVFEVLQKFSDSPVETHEKCGGHVERLLSAPTFQFKGSGWYVTDCQRLGKIRPNGGNKPSFGGRQDDAREERFRETRFSEPRKK
jgi:putative FmdB family regulatory protein